MASSSPPLPPAKALIILFVFSILAVNSSSQPFKCTTNATCRSLVDYVSPNTTTISVIKTLFSIKNLRIILGANNLPLSTSPNLTIAEQQKIKIPFSCICVNGTGVSNKKPTYTIQSGDTLDHIAREVFSGLMNFEQISAVNNIPDPNVIKVGQELWIPLPCSCDEVNGEKVVHYGHVVEAGSTLDLIAQEYGTNKDTLVSINGITNESSLLAGQVLDVPLRACNSSVITTSIDYPLLVPNGTYVFTANNCVKCKCDSANWKLQCEPSGLKPANSTWSTCPSMLCGGDLSLGNTTTSTCNTATCAYSGFSNQNQTIMTTLDNASTCSSNPPGSDSHASSMGLSWKFVFIWLHLIMLCVYPF